MLETLVGGALGAFFAAWAGAYLGFRRSKRERALDRRVGWHEQAIQGLAEYEECLERLRGHALYVLVIESTTIGATTDQQPEPADLPRLVRAPAPLWNSLAAAEARARAVLRLADLYTEGKTKIDCSVAMDQSVNMVSSHWVDIAPDPQIPWLQLRLKAADAAVLRRKLQESLIVVLELGGFWASLLGEKYRQKRALKGIDKLRAEYTKSTS